MRTLNYAQAIREAFAQLLANDPQVFVIGQGLWSPWYVGTSMRDLDKEFGRSRVIDSPVSENATTGSAIGAALVGMRPIVVHPRMDFMLLATDHIVNQAANWCYMFNGKVNVPLVIRPIINRGGQQGAQHAQALQAWFAHVPGLKVVMPSSPYDAKGLLIASVYDNDPVMYIDDRWLYEQVGSVPDGMYQVPIGQGIVRRHGKDVTVVASSHMVVQAEKSAEKLAEMGIDTEVIDLRTIKPIDSEMIVQSVKRTGRLVIADGGWATCGVSAEIAALVVESDAMRYLTAPVRRLALPAAPAPTSASLERVYYPDADDIVTAVREVMEMSES